MRISGQPRLIGERGRGRCSALSTAGPASPSAGRPAQRSKLIKALSVRGLKAPLKAPEGKPCQASMNWKAATSQPFMPLPSLRLPSVLVA